MKLILHNIMYFTKESSSLTYNRSNFKTKTKTTLSIMNFRIGALPNCKRKLFRIEIIIVTLMSPKGFPNHKILSLNYHTLHNPCKGLHS